MTLGALVDAGLPLAELKRGMAKLPLKGYRLVSRPVRKGAIAATKVDVKIANPGHHHHTPLRSILALIKNGVSLFDVPVEMQYILIGVLLLANVSLNRWRQRK